MDDDDKPLTVAEDQDAQTVIKCPHCLRRIGVSFRVTGCVGENQSINCPHCHQHFVEHFLPGIVISLFTRGQ